MPRYTGSCYCRQIQYELNLSSPDDARTSLCHCRNCKASTLPSQSLAPVKLSELTENQKAFGTDYGLTAKIPKDTITLTSGNPKEHAADNGSGVVIHREFCDHCGTYILEYGVSGVSCSVSG